MQVMEYLEKTARKAQIQVDLHGHEAEAWVSKFDGSYMTLVGMEDQVQFLADREITDHLTHGVGFSPKSGEWFGWSHRAIYGFKVGSTCKKGDCHYRAANLEDEIENARAFWSDEFRLDVKAEQINESEIGVTWKYDDHIPNPKMRGQSGGSTWPIPTEFGRGEWVAGTMEDARQMAVDFNAGVS